MAVMMCDLSCCQDWVQVLCFLDLDIDGLTSQSLRYCMRLTYTSVSSAFAEQYVLTSWAWRLTFWPKHQIKSNQDRWRLSCEPAWHIWTFCSFPYFSYKRSQTDRQTSRVQFVMQRAAFLYYYYFFIYPRWWRGVVVNALVAINEVTLRRARLVLRWVTVCGRVKNLGI